MRYVKSPFNYIGGKYNLLDDIVPLFPKNVETFVDLFGGGATVGINANAETIIINDMNHKVIDVFKYIQNNSINHILEGIDYLINKYSLSKTNEDGFLRLRKDYNNSNQSNPLELYVLICYSYNYQFRFNNNLEYNSSFGRNRSQFTKNMEDRLIDFHKKLQEKIIIFNSEYFEEFNYDKLDINDFVYCDPPYSITTGNYNDGNRGFKNWCPESDRLLMETLDALSVDGVMWGLSNVIEHKGKINTELNRWAKKYNIIEIEKNYNNSSYNSRGKGTREVLILNY